MGTAAGHVVWLDRALNVLGGVTLPAGEAQAQAWVEEVAVGLRDGSVRGLAHEGAELRATLQDGRVVRVSE